MATKDEVAKVIIDQGVLPLYFHPDLEVSTGVLRAVQRAGLKAVEYTNRGSAALDNFKKLVATRNSEMPGMLIGVGTIKTMDDARNYVDAGADFLVSPGVIPEIIDYANSIEMFYAPGCMTPSDIIQAENKGIVFIKIFPGNVLGPGFVSAVKDLFPKLLFMPTGGVDITKENLEEWFKAGVCAVGMGSKLVSKKLMEQKNYEGIEKITRDVVSIIRQIRNG